MFKSLYNQASLVFRIKPVSPLLIKTGKESFDPTRPDMEFIRTRTPFGEVPYLPGSSLKGVIRSYGERILRTLNLNCCDVTLKEGGCRKESEVMEERYRQHCYICRTFGSTSLSSRLRITDANPWRLEAEDEEIKKVVSSIDDYVPTSRRTSVRIDRQKGSAAGGALFETEVVTGGHFWGEISLANYQLWQLALLSLIFRDINRGLQRFGASKSRGLGRVSFQIERAQFQQYGQLATGGDKFCGVAALGEKIIKRYGLLEEDLLTPLPQDIHWDSENSVPGFVDAFTFGDDPEKGWKSLAKSLVEAPIWQSFLEEGDKNESAS